MQSVVCVFIGNCKWKRHVFSPLWHHVGLFTFHCFNSLTFTLMCKLTVV